MIRKITKNIHSFKWILYLLVVPVFLIGYKTNNSLVNSFGCFDDCHVFSTAYFMLNGKEIYSEVFFNHNPLMPFLSFVIQLISEPKSIYELLLRHRQTIFLISLLFNLVLLLRFRYKALGFVLLFELTKFYTFGNRFLPEALVVYPIIYLFALGFEKLQKKKISVFDLIISAFFCWFIVFMREPYVPVALFLFGYIIWKIDTKWQLTSLAVFVILSVFTFISLPLEDFYFNVVTFNLSETVGKEVTSSTFFGVDLLKIIFYPLYILFPIGNFGYYRQLLVFESIFFVILLLFNYKNFAIKGLIYLLLVLALSNVRFTEPGIAFYAAYHMNVWYGLFTFSLVFLMSQIKSKLNFIISLTVFIGILLFSISKESILWEKIDQQEQLLTNYGQQMLYVQVLEKLSDPSDTLFLDGWDEIIYSQAKLPSSYQYSHFTSQMPNIQKYQEARNHMFRNNPPVFYYGTCREDVNQKLPAFIKNRYIRIYHMGKPTCLYVLDKKYEKINSVTPEISFENEK